MQVETDQDEQRRIEDEIVDLWNYEEADAIIDWSDADEEHIHIEDYAKEID